MSDQRDRIRSLLTLASHPNTPQAEAETALALASKLMQKHGITEHEVEDASIDNAHFDNVDVVVERVLVCGAYRVRRVNVLYVLATVHSCVGYRDDDERGDDGTECSVLVLYGRPADIAAARTLFAAADAMAARLMPRGTRSARTTWLKGFQSGLEEALAAAKQEFIAENRGSGLVLADRMTRAKDEMRSQGIRVRGGYSYADTSTGAWQAGHNAGRSFGAAGRSFTSGVAGELT